MYCEYPKAKITASIRNLILNKFQIITNGIIEKIHHLLLYFAHLHTYLDHSKDRVKIH